MESVFLPIFVSSVSNGLAMVTTPNLIVQKVCSPAHQPPINHFICNDTELLAQATGMAMTKSTIRSVLSAVSSPLLGGWRDSTGNNKALLYIGEVSEGVIALSYLFGAWFWSGSPWLPVMMEAVVGGLFGMGASQLGYHCIIIEGSKAGEITMRIQRLSTIILVSFLVATIARGLLLESIGYGSFFFLAACLHLAAMLLIRTSIRDGRKDVPKEKKESIFFRLSAVFAPRPNRKVVWLMLISKPLFSTFFMAEMAITPYFLQQAFQFTVKDETFHGSYGMLISLAGSFAMPYLLIKYLKWSDFKIGITSSALAIGTSIIMATTKSRTVLYIVPILDLLKYNLFSLPQAILGKCIGHGELGLFNGVSSFLGIFLPFVVNQIYQSTFSATSQTMPGAIYLISAVGNIFIFAVYCLSANTYIQPPDLRKKFSEENTAVEKILETKKVE